MEAKSMFVPQTNSQETIETPSFETEETLFILFTVPAVSSMILLINFSASSDLRLRI
jgi:hypothetical protein